MVKATKKDNRLTRRRVRLAIAGLGLAGRRHAEAIRSAAGVILCAVAETGEEGRKEAERHGVPCFGSLAEMIEAEKPEGVILSTPTPLHVEQGLQCIEAGIPVLVEKPLADDLGGAGTLVERSEAAGVALMVGHHRRFNPIIERAHSIIAGGKIGDVRAVHATCWFYKPDHYFDAAPWRKLKGAGPVSVNLVHDIDLIRHLCGEITHVQAQAAPSARGFENEDVASALFRFGGGAIGTVTVSDGIVAPWSWEFTSREFGVYPYTAVGAYQIGGTHGSLSVPDLTLWTHDKARDWWTPISGKATPCATSDPLVNQVEHFGDVIARGERPRVPGREGLRTLAVIDAIQTSAEAGRAVDLDADAGVRVEAPRKAN